MFLIKTLQNAFYNFSVLERRRVDIAVGVSYAEDLEKVEDVVLSAIKNLKDKDLMVLTTLNLTLAINFNIRFWIKYPENPATSMRSKAIKTIKKVFDEQNITIPFH
jgi:small conductance mechanosensitive channel